MKEVLDFCIFGALFQRSFQLLLMFYERCVEAAFPARKQKGDFRLKPPSNRFPVNYLLYIIISQDISSFDTVDEVGCLLDGLGILLHDVAAHLGHGVGLGGCAVA